MTREVEQDRRKQLENLYTRSYGYILDLALTDKRLLPQDGERIAQSVAAHLDSYGGPLDSESFQKWIARIIAPAVERLSTFGQWMREYRDSVRSGIWSILGKNLDLRDHSNPSAIAERIEFDTWFWALQHMDDLLEPGSARLSTRLYAQGKLHALTWRKSRLRDLERFDDSDVEHYGTSENTEVDECGNITRDAAYIYDPGGHEDDDEDEDEPPRPQTKFFPIPSLSDRILAMRSGIPKLLCPVCQSMQDISPELATTDETMRLVCGHKRPALLPKMAAALKG